MTVTNFINFNQSKGVYIATHRDSFAYACDDIFEFLESVYKQEPACLSIDDAKYMSDALCDGLALSERFPDLDSEDDDMIDAIEAVYSELVQI